jgi:hypothetical protein
MFSSVWIFVSVPAASAAAQNPGDTAIVIRRTYAIELTTPESAATLFLKSETVVSISPSY